MKTKAFGLDIGSTSMKAVWLAEDRKSLFLKSFITAPTPSKGMLSESVLDQEEMAHAIKKLLIDGKITTPYAHIALPDNQVFTKVIDMPILSDKELGSAILWEAEQYIPAPLSTITLDWQVLRRQSNQVADPKMQVMLVGAPTALIKRYQDILALDGVMLSSIETETLSVIRALVTNEQFPTALIMNIGAHSTSLAIVQTGVVVFTYSIPLGGLALNRAISADFGFSPNQAEEYKRVYGMSGDTLGGKVGKAIEPILQSILLEVKKALTFYSEKYKSELPIKQILLSGGTAKLPGIDLFFVKQIGIETVIANPWKTLNIQNVPKEILDLGSEYTIAIGLGLKEYEQ